MSHYSRDASPVKRPARKQRVQLLRLPEAMLDAQQQAFPETFERNAIVALFALRTLAQRINDYTNEALAPLGLNAAKFNYLIVLYLNAEPLMTLSELSRFIHTSNATVTAMVRGLERDGLVLRRAHDMDGRSTLVGLTAAGRQLVERAAPVHHAHWLDALADLSLDERAQLADLIIRAGTGFDQHFNRET
jgi:DNA-binding MarR family transcriptional regulator